ncbi:hypothetical protein [Chlamydia sp. 17-3921]|uniref:hypothetical protein n=1 Tax=Chlamydia sp. 17-3921 TaxID=2675798 RepID=UPI00191A72CA|nr:hypothetical protein [Chlamydia sp. 17-3921]
MACYFFTNYNVGDVEEGSLHHKVLSSTIDLLLYPVVSLIIGIFATILLLIKSLYKIITFLIARLYSSCSGKETLKASSWFDCILSLSEDPCYYAAPLLLIPVIGAAFYAFLIARSFIQNEGGEGVSRLNTAIVVCQAPWALLEHATVNW